MKFTIGKLAITEACSAKGLHLQTTTIRRDQTYSLSFCTASTNTFRLHASLLQAGTPTYHKAGIALAAHCADLLFAALLLHELHCTAYCS